MTDRKPIDDILHLPFVFVPHGAPEPTEWRARHPGWVSFPATLRLPPTSQRRTTTDTLQVRDMVPNERAGAASRPTGRLTTSRNPAHVDSFFDRTHDSLVKLARELGVPATYILGLAAHESFWMNPHNTRLNNPFGLTAGGGNNLSFASIDEAIAYWSRLYGNQVRGATSPEDFVGRLLGEINGSPMPGWRRYNSKDSLWREKTLGLIETVERRMPLWNRTP